MKVVISVALLLVWNTVAVASHLPLVEGAVWYYTSSSGVSVQRTVEGTQLVGGATTSVLKNLRPGSVEEEWWNFWTVDEQGRVFLHGYRNLTAGFGVRYDPPLLWIAPGETSWNTVTTARDLDLDVEVAFLDAQVAAVEDVPIEVPAGPFSTLALDVSIVSVDPAKAMAFDALGRRLVDGGAKRATDQLWYADGVGLVRESFCCPSTTDELSSYQVVATDAVSWGDVKIRFER